MNAKKVPAQILHVAIQNIYLCIDITYIKKIFPLVLLESVPGAPHYLAGLMNYAGLSIPVIDLALRLNLPYNKTYSLNTPIILCVEQDRQIGIIVENILGLAETNAVEFQHHSEFDEANSFFLSSILFNSQSSLLLNMNEIIQSGFAQEVT